MSNQFHSPPLIRSELFYLLKEETCTFVVSIKKLNKIQISTNAANISKCCKCAYHNGFIFNILEYNLNSFYKLEAL